MIRYRFRLQRTPMSYRLPRQTAATFSQGDKIPDPPRFPRGWSADIEIIVPEGVEFEDALDMLAASLMRQSAPTMLERRD